MIIMGPDTAIFDTTGKTERELQTAVQFTIKSGFPDCGNSPQSAL
jgi:hypothetical protein